MIVIFREIRRIKLNLKYKRKTRRYFLGVKKLAEEQERIGKAMCDKLIKMSKLGEYGI